MLNFPSLFFFVTYNQRYSNFCKDRFEKDAQLSRRYLWFIAQLNALTQIFLMNVAGTNYKKFARFNQFRNVKPDLIPYFTYPTKIYEKSKKTKKEEAETKVKYEGLSMHQFHLWHFILSP